MKEFYIGPVRRQLNDSTVVLANLEKTNRHVEGRKIFIPLSYGGGAAVGSKAEYATLPTAHKQTYKETDGRTKYHYGRIEVTGPAIKATANDVGAFLRVIGSEMKGVLRDLRKDLNRQLFGDGTGLLAVVPDATAGAANQIVVDSASKLVVGMEIDVHEADYGSVLGSSTITAISGTTVTVALADIEALLSEDDCNVTRKGAYLNELEGFKLAVATAGTYFGIDRASYDFWKAQVTTGDTTLSLDVLQTGIDEVDIAGGLCDTFISTHALRRKLASLMVAKQEYRNTMELKGGFKVLSYNDIPVMADKDCPAETFYFLDRSSFAIYHMSDWEWAEENGSVLTKVSGKDAYEAWIFWYSNLGSDFCACQNVYTAMKTS